MKPPIFIVLILLATEIREGRCLSNRNINRCDFFVQGSPTTQVSRSSKQSAYNIATSQPLVHRHLGVRGGKAGVSAEELDTVAGKSGNNKEEKLTGKTDGAEVGTGADAGADAGAGAGENDSTADTRTGSIAPPTSRVPATAGGCGGGSGGGGSGGGAVGVSGGAGTASKGVVVDAQEEALRTALLQAQGPSK